jgi:hypothetical protein
MPDALDYGLAPKASLGRIVIYAPTDSERSNGANSLPAMIVRVWSDICVNLKVFADGDHSYWKTSVTQGTAQGQWMWPPKFVQATASPGPMIPH